MAETTLPKLHVSREEARQKIQGQIGKGQKLRNREIRSGDRLEEARTECQKWSKYNKVLLSRLFDNTAIAEDDYTDFDDTPSVVIIGEPMPFSGKLDWYQNGMDSSINSLESIHDRLDLYDEPSKIPQRISDNEEISDTPQPTFGDDVFIVHGRDEAAKHAMARFVERLGLKPIILDEQPNAGLTIIEKLEREAKNVGFAIALLTPDDVGALKDEADDQPKPRARQNVILELGYFMGKLGRKKVCLLIKGELENPSDLDGILYVPMASSNGWQLQLAKEMKQAGLPVDLNKLV